MRKLKDSVGVVAKIDFIRGYDAYAAMLEGTPYLARRFRLLQEKKVMEGRGQFVYGLELLEQEIAVLPKDTGRWAPNERWSAKLVWDEDFQRAVRRYVIVHWYQEADDPMQRLAYIVESMALNDYGNEEAFEID
ncbi:hypothetical protein [Pseudoduganella sp. R-34]|uniref:hypothetical protein n=1 Tax=Pseudoduganella sp. R-34 TaxID=3404062 RepID=UPI003CF8855F